MMFHSEVALKGSNEGKCTCKPVNRVVMVVAMKAMQGHTVRTPLITAGLATASTHAQLPEHR